MGRVTAYSRDLPRTTTVAEDSHRPEVLEALVRAALDATG